MKTSLGKFWNYFVCFKCFSITRYNYIKKNTIKIYLANLSLQKLIKAGFSAIRLARIKLFVKYF